MGSVGFKEWALVCEALGQGKQSILLRKGGIAEGRAGFSFQHREFFLFPTYFHGQVERVRTAGARVPEQRAGEIEISLFVRMESSAVVDLWQTAAALKRFHVLREDVVRERFEYDAAPGIHVALVRVFRLEPAWRFADHPRYGGCRSWVNLPELPEGTALVPVLTHAEHEERARELREIVGTRAASLPA
jgi:hypothetical protein